MISTDGREGSKAPVVLRPVIIFRIDKWVVNSKGSYKFYMNCTSFHQFVCTADTELGMSAGDQAGITFPVTTYDTSLVVIGLLWERFQSYESLCPKSLFLNTVQ